jgi:hypothetical protein|tara:strand:+ start:167 stop:439 length:273 start_codon:yes stop_codon:yes gene_type:complete
MIRLATLLLILSGVTAVAWGSPLSDAKEAGLVQESVDGYVTSAKGASKRIQELVNDVNKRRRAAYQKIADKNGISIEQVGRESYVRRHRQ